MAPCRRAVVAIAALLPARPTHAQSSARETVLPAGIGIVVEVAVGVSADGAARGGRPVLRVAQPVVVARDTVVATGAAVYTALARPVGPRASRVWRLLVDSTFAVDGTRLLVDGAQAIAGAPDASVAALAGAGPAALGRCDRIVVRVRETASVRIVRDTTSSHRAPPIASCVANERELRLRNQRSAVPAVILDYLLPGTGHMYAGDSKRGFLFLGVALAASAAAASYKYDDRTGHWRNGDVAAAGYLVYLGMAVGTAIDAPRTMRRRNERILTDPDAFGTTVRRDP